MKLPYLFNPIYRFARRVTPERIKPDVRGLYNKLNKFVTYGHSDVFTALDIETNSRCNLKCTYCPVSRYNRGDNYMPEELFKKIIDDVAAFPFTYKGRISPHFYGDPLLDKRLPELMAYTRQKLPKASIIIHTNGVALTPEMYRGCVEAGITGFLITRHLPKIPPAVQKIQETESDANKFIIIQRLDNVGIFERGGIRPVKKAHQFKRCFYLSDEIAIDYKGNVVCTNDFFIRDGFGDVNQRSLGEIWWSPEFKKVRSDLRNGNITLQHCREVCGIDKADYSHVPTNAKNKDVEPWVKPPVTQPENPVHAAKT